MAYLHKWMNQSHSTRRLRSIVGLEALETRSLLAGLVNLPDSLIQAPYNPSHALAAEVGQIRAESIATQATPIHRSPIILSSVEADEHLEFADSIWSANRNWISDAKSHSQDAQDSTKYDGTGELDHKDDGLSNGSDIKHNDSLTPGVPATTTDEDTPPTTSPPSTTPSFVSIVATSPATNQQWDPPRSAANSPWPALPLPSHAPLSFRYFNQSPQRNRVGDPSLSSEPLTSAAVQETFAAFSLSGLSELPLNAPAHEATPETASKTAFHRAVPSTAQPAVQPSAHTPLAHADIVDRAKTAIAQATEIVRAADASCAVMGSPSGRNHRIVDQSLAHSLTQNALAAGSAKTPSTSTPNSPHSRSNGLQLGFFSLVSMLLSFRTSATQEVNPDAQPFEQPTKVARKKKPANPTVRQRRE